MVHVARPQMVQQERRPVYPLWEKVQEYSSMQGMPLRSAALEKRGWSTRWEVVMYMKYRECDYKGTKMQENQRQEFLPKAQLSNMWCGNCKRGWEWRNAEGEAGRGIKVKCTKCGKKDMAVDKKICREEL